MSKIDYKVLTATAGLCAHSIADGVALGASLFMSFEESASMGLGYSVIIALLIHKVPEALSFGSYLIVKKVTRAQQISCVTSLGLTSPIVALVTYLLLGSFSQTDPAS